MFKKFFWVLIILIIANVIAWSFIYDSNDLEVVFFDVGQGDSIYIEYNNFQVLIDGGPGNIVLEKLGENMPFYDKTIELLILTHPDHDHLFGLLEVLKRYEVDNILWTGYERDTAEYKEWLRLIEGHNIIIAEQGNKIDLLRGIYLYIHSADVNAKDCNDSSIVASLVFDDIEFLFTGDITDKVEKQLDVQVDVLKIAHHGSNSSSCSEFLETVSPDLAVISVGENNYGHPSSEVLQRLKEFGIPILITKELGDIKLITNGQDIYGY